MITVPFSGDVTNTRLALHEDGGRPPLFRESARRGGVGPHSPQMYGYFHDRENIYLIMEYAPDRSLCKKTVSPCKAAKYVHDMSMSLEVIHSENIARRDLKTDYIVLVMRFRSAVLLVLAALAIATGFHAQK